MAIPSSVGNPDLVIRWFSMRLMPVNQEARLAEQNRTARIIPSSRCRSTWSSSPSTRGLGPSANESKDLGPCAHEPVPRCFHYNAPKSVGSAVRP
jgi:hypothetical protein